MSYTLVTYASFIYILDDTHFTTENVAVESLQDWRMPSSERLCRVALVRTDVSEELIASVILLFLPSVFRLLVTAIVVPSMQILVNLMTEAIRSSITLVLTRATWHSIPKDAILQSPLCTPQILQSVSRIIYETERYDTYYQALWNNAVTTKMP
jgi:hypothetical protein